MMIPADEEFQVFSLTVSNSSGQRPVQEPRPGPNESVWGTELWKQLVQTQQAQRSKQLPPVKTSGWIFLWFIIIYFIVFRLVWFSHRIRNKGCKINFRTIISVVSLIKSICLWTCSNWAQRPRHMFRWWCSGLSARRLDRVAALEPLVKNRPFHKQLHEFCPQDLQDSVSTDLLKVSVIIVVCIQVRIIICQSGHQQLSLDEDWAQEWKAQRNTRRTSKQQTQ